MSNKRKAKKRGRHPEIKRMRRNLAPLTAEERAEMEARVAGLAAEQRRLIDRMRGRVITRAQAKRMAGPAIEVARLAPEKLAEVLIGLPADAVREIPGLGPMDAVKPPETMGDGTVGWFFPDKTVVFHREQGHYRVKEVLQA